MRHTDNRYNHERRSLAVAMRMIRFEARTCTIQRCTGLSEDRIRKLYKSYFAHEQSGTQIVRRRGKSPREIDCVLRNARLQQQASLLAGAFATLGLLPRPPSGGTLLIDAALGDKLCDAYDVYRQLLSDNPLSFEHAWFLWQALAKGSDLQLRSCPHCDGLTLQDRFSIRMRNCPWCESPAPLEQAGRPQQKRRAGKRQTRPNAVIEGASKRSAENGNPGSRMAV